MLNDIHENFIDHVKERRAGKLSDEADLFNGEIWLGNKAKDLGLIDGIGHLKPVMKERFGKKVTFRRYGMRRPFLSRLGGQMLNDAVGQLEERAAYAQYGL